MSELITDCTTPDDCRITEGPRSSTLMGFTQVYDGHGKGVHTDPNTTSFTRSCSTCDKYEIVSIQGGEETITAPEGRP